MLKKQRQAYPQYKQPVIALENFTNKSGVCNFDLGGNNYTVIAELGQIVGFKDEVIVELQENNATSLELNLTEFSLLLSFGDILLFVFVCGGLLFALICVFAVIKKYKNRFNVRIDIAACFP